MTYANTGINTNIINKYQGVASSNVIRAVATAAKETGADFSFLMEKASAESGFDPSAKAKTSSATGLFQFIDSTWLSMVKQYGPKYGLQNMANQIEIKNGKPCVSDCAIKDQILNLRKNPEISALMAGEFSSDNKEFLQQHTQGDVGSTELYLAHFMGAQGAAKFLNCRSCNGDTAAADIFPNAARANKAVFYDQSTGHPRTLNQIYDFFGNKFDDSTGGTAPSTQAVLSAPLTPAYTGSTTAPRPTPAINALDLAGALPLFDDSNEADDIIWRDDPRFSRSAHSAANQGQSLSHLGLLVMAQMTGHRDRFGFNA